jgi:2-methylcitrate dehydratase PrpD
MKTAYGVAALDLNLTRDLCAFLSRFRYEDLPREVVHEARRGLLDWIGCALAGSQHRTIDMLLAVLRSVGGQPQSTVFGRGLKLGPLEAPIANGQMGHLLDFDDTHMGGVVLHASSPILSALFALGDRGGVDGKRLICAYVAGFEAGVRTGQASPRHHDGGWHLTGTLGAIAAGAAAGKLIGLDAQKLTYALGIAATQAAGMQQNRGTSCKSLHAGKAGASGVLAALLAEQGFDSSEEIVEGKRGFARIYSTEADPEALTAELGSRWEITHNGYKPYACGVVLHPLIDAVIAAAKKAGTPADAVQAIELKVHPHAVKITGVDNPQSGLMAKFSINHAASVSYIDGNAGIAQFSDARAADAGVLALRRKVAVDTVESFGKDEAKATVITSAGARYDVHIPHASGTVANPMADEALVTKFIGNAEPVLGAERAREVVDLVWRLDTLADIRDITQACA